MKLRLRLLWINIKNTWQAQTAYFGDSWGNVLSTMVYTLTFFLFVTVIYGNVRTLGGYTRDQMLFFVLINQLSFYLIYAWNFNNVQRLVMDVNRGSFDLLLVKPLPALFYTSTREINLLSMLRDGIPGILFITLAINWHHISIAPQNILLGIVCFMAGQLALNGLFFLLAMPVFWFGQAADLLDLGYSFSSVDLPYEGVSRNIRLGLTLAIPALVPSSLTASVILGKSNPLANTALAVAAAIILILAKNFTWRRALLNYTSASS
jgi:ABC-2 type transport system permease protein